MDEPRVTGPPAAPSKPATRPESASGPEHPRAVLAALILVAAVANLNLSVANVALPDIGKAFDASQTGLDLIAVGFSLRLGCLCALPGSSRGPLRAAHDAATGYDARDPSVTGGCPSTVDRGAVLRPPGRRPGGGHGLSHHAGADHCPVVGWSAYSLDRALVRLGRQHVGAWATDRGGTADGF